jgi:choline dehydrogenase
VTKAASSYAREQDTWDTIIVGAGAAGCVLANRLTASGRHRVLLLEAGGNDSKLWIKVPAGFTRTIFDNSIGWGYANAPAPHTGNRAIPCPRGRVLGGSSSINGHLYVRGQADDYADWVALGAAGWGWDAVLPYFCRAESRANGDTATRGHDGPLQVTNPRMQHPLCAAFIDALHTLGEPLNPDYNSGDQRGAGYYQYLMQNGRRWSAADAYLRPALTRRNLALRTHAHATRIVFEGRRAVGIEYRHQGQLRVARAAGEVILAGGSINSPQLLQLSGVGDPTVLQAAGVIVTHALAGVGENLVDHYAARVAARVRGTGSLNERTHLPRVALEVFKYLFARRGVLSSAVAHAYGFVNVAGGADAAGPGQGAAAASSTTPGARERALRPDVQLLFAPASFERGKMGQAAMERLPGLTCGVQQLRPHSRGHVRIASNDPFAAPEIQPNYLADERDVEALLNGIKYVRRLFGAAPLSMYIESETWPGEDADDDHSLVDFARNTGATVYHPVGTCRMGTGGDAPVDPATLRVKGLEALRVIDASVMPSMISGNTYATTIMIAEKGAELMLAG